VLAQVRTDAKARYGGAWSREDEAAFKVVMMMMNGRTRHQVNRRTLKYYLF
jgi:hypothetical protein